VQCFVDFTEKKINDQMAYVNAAKASYIKVWEEEFSQEKDVCQIYGEENIFRYLPLKSVGLRVQAGDEPTDIAMVAMATTIVGTPFCISIAENNECTKYLKAMKNIKVIVQDEQAFIADMPKYERIRVCSPASDAIYKAAAKLGKHVADRKPLAEGRLELLHYLKEQSIAFEYHRYGSIFGEEK
jgi:RHH-type proline utilization regulon transcriptional repressor/proline dehydrogenase/delta 1-pyrroline-5-carboxylate dehydrogenase